MTDLHNKMKDAIHRAEAELQTASYLEESGSNAGLRKMNANKADWLSLIIYLAKLGFETELLVSDQNKPTYSAKSTEVSKTLNELEAKDKLIKELLATIEQLKAEAESLKVESDLAVFKANVELEKYQAKLERAKIDTVVDLAGRVYDLVYRAPMVEVSVLFEALNNYLNELSKK